ELGLLVEIPKEIADLARMSDPSGKDGSVPADPALQEPPPAPPLFAPHRIATAEGPLAPVESLRGVGPAVAEKLRAKGLLTVHDVLLNLPTRYEDRRTPRLVADAPLGERSVIAGSIAKVNEVKSRYGRRRLEVLLRDDAHSALLLLWFHFRASLLERLRPGARILVRGE